MQGRLARRGSSWCATSRRSGELIRIFAELAKSCRELLGAPRLFFGAARLFFGASRTANKSGANIGSSG